jgi:hypothetical protein
MSNPQQRAHLNNSGDALCRTRSGMFVPMLVVNAIEQTTCDRCKRAYANKQRALRLVKVTASNDRGAE